MSKTRAGCTFTALKHRIASQKEEWLRLVTNSLRLAILGSNEGGWKPRSGQEASGHFSRFAAEWRFQTTVSSRGFLVVLQDRHRVNGWNVPSFGKSAIDNPPNDHCIKSSLLTLPDHGIPDMNDHQFISHG